MSDYQPPSQEWLENEAEKVYKLQKPKEYAQEKAKPGVMAEYRKMSAEDCRAYAEGLMHQGVSDPFQAWDRAIRETIHRAEMD